MALEAAMVLIEKICDALMTQSLAKGKPFYSYVENARRELEDIKHRLGPLQEFLKIADRHANYNKLAREWMKDVQKLIFEMEVLVDVYIYIEGSKIETDITAMYDIAGNLQNAKNSIQALYDGRNVLGIEMAIVPSTSIDVEASHTTPDENILGIDENKDKLIEWLKDEKSSERKLICVWGKAGVGKTTLVDCVYQSPLIVKHFDCRARVSLSRNYNRDDLLRKIIAELQRDIIAPRGLACMDYGSLAVVLQQFLKDKRLGSNASSTFHSTEKITGRY